MKSFGLRSPLALSSLNATALFSCGCKNVRAWNVVYLDHKFIHSRRPANMSGARVSCANVMPSALRGLRLQDATQATNRRLSIEDAPQAIPRARTRTPSRTRSRLRPVLRPSTT